MANLKFKFVQAYDGEWIMPKMSGYKMRCCDCRLVHVVDFQVRKGRVYMKPSRDNRSTAASRRSVKR